MERAGSAEANRTEGGAAVTRIPGLPVMVGGNRVPLKPKKPKQKSDVRKSSDILDKLTGYRWIKTGR